MSETLSTPHKSTLFLAHFKAYHSLEETTKTIEILVKRLENTLLNLHIALPFSYIAPLTTQLSNEHITIGAETMLDTSPTSFPGTISSKMLKDAGAKFVLIGTSMERQDDTTKKTNYKEKVTSALKLSLTPILCINDSLQEFHEGSSQKILKDQLQDALKEIPSEQLLGLTILYDAAWINEAPWDPSSSVLQQAYQNFQEAIKSQFDPSIADQIKLIYAIPTHNPNLSKIREVLPSERYSLGTLRSLNPEHLPAEWA